MIKFVVTLETYNTTSGYLEETQDLGIFDDVHKALEFEKAQEQEYTDSIEYYHSICTLVKKIDES